MVLLLFIVVGLFGLLIFVIFLGWGYMFIGGVFVIIILNLLGLMCVCESVIVFVFVSVKEVSLGLGVIKW